MAAGSVVTEDVPPRTLVAGRSGAPRARDRLMAGARAAEPPPRPAVAALRRVCPFARGLLSRAEPLFPRPRRSTSSRCGCSRCEGLRAGELRLLEPVAHAGDAAVPSAPRVLPAGPAAARSGPTEAGVSLRPRPARAAGRARAVRAGARPRSLPPGRGGRRAGVRARRVLRSPRSTSTSTCRRWPGPRSSYWALGRAGGGRAAGRGRGRASWWRVAPSTHGAEIVAQALLFGVVLGVPAGARVRPAAGRRGRARARARGAERWLHAAGAGRRQSARGAGFTTGVVLAHSVHPLTWPAGARRRVPRRYSADLANAGGDRTSSRAGSRTC